MKEKLKLLQGTGLIILLVFLGLAIGTRIGALFVPKGSGLAGPAIALGYGVIGAAIALIIGVLMVRKMSAKNVRTALIAAFVVTSLLMIWLMLARSRKASQADMPAMPRPTAPVDRAPSAFAVNAVLHAAQNQQQPLGIGMARPHLQAGGTLYFYGVRDVTVMPDQLVPQDSLTFKQGEHFVEIATAPPWFWPEVTKLDYNLLYLRAKTVSRNWLEVVVNRQSGQTAWVDRQAVECVLWPDFLLSVYAVELLDPTNNPMRIKPLLHASPVALPERAQLKPLAMQGDWLRVEILDDAGQARVTGWIRWRDAQGLLIRYSLLS